MGEAVGQLLKDPVAVALLPLPLFLPLLLSSERLCWAFQASAAARAASAPDSAVAAAADAAAGGGVGAAVFVAAIPCNLFISATVGCCCVAFS